MWDWFFSEQKQRTSNHKHGHLELKFITGVHHKVKIFETAMLFSYSTAASKMSFAFFVGGFGRSSTLF